MQKAKSVFQRGLSSSTLGLSSSTLKTNKAGRRSNEFEVPNASTDVEVRAKLRRHLSLANELFSVAEDFVASMEISLAMVDKLLEIFRSVSSDWLTGLYGESSAMVWAMAMGVKSTGPRVIEEVKRHLCHLEKVRSFTRGSEAALEKRDEAQQERNHYLLKLQVLKEEHAERDKLGIVDSYQQSQRLARNEEKLKKAEEELSGCRAEVDRLAMAAQLEQDQQTLIASLHGVAQVSSCGWFISTGAVVCQAMRQANSTDDTAEQGKEPAGKPEPRAEADGDGVAAAAEAFARLSPRLTDEIAAAEKARRAAAAAAAAEEVPAKGKAAQAFSPSASASMGKEALEQLSVAQLRACLRVRGLSDAGCIEKSELIALLRSVQEPEPERKSEDTAKVEEAAVPDSDDPGVVSADNTPASAPPERKGSFHPSLSALDAEVSDVPMSVTSLPSIRSNRNGSAFKASAWPTTPTSANATPAPTPDSALWEPPRSSILGGAEAQAASAWPSSPDSEHLTPRDDGADVANPLDLFGGPGPGDDGPGGPSAGSGEAPRTREEDEAARRQTLDAMPGMPLPDLAEAMRRHRDCLPIQESGCLLLEQFVFTRNEGRTQPNPQAVKELLNLDAYATVVKALRRLASSEDLQSQDAMKAVICGLRVVASVHNVAEGRPMWKREVLLEQHGIRAIVEVLRTFSEARSVQGACAQALGICAMGSSPDLPQEIAAAGGVELLKASMRRFAADKYLQTQACQAVRLLAQGGVDLGSVDVLLATMCSCGEDEGIQVNLCKTFATMAADSHRMAALSELGGAAAVLASMRAFEASQPLQLAACEVLGGLAHAGRGPLLELLDLGGLDAAVRVSLRSGASAEAQAAGRKAAASLVVQRATLEAMRHIGMQTSAPP